MGWWLEPTTDPSGNVQFPGAVSVGEENLDDAAFAALPNGASYIDTASGEIIQKMRGQPLLIGGVLYERQSPFGNTVTTSGNTTVDVGTVAGRGGLKPVIKAGFLNSKHYGLLLSSSVGLNITDTATQRVTLEHLIGANVISRMYINLAGVPNIPASISGVIADLEVEVMNASAFVAASNPVRSHARTIVGYLRTGTGATVQDIAVPIVNEIYPGNINTTIDNVITTRVNLSGVGPTVYYNKIKIRI